MSFDVFLQRFKAGEPAQVNREPVLAVLRAARHSGPDDSGSYAVKFSDGEYVEFSAKGLQGPGDFSGCAFHIRCMCPGLVRFMFEIAKAGDMVVLPVMEDFVPILSSPGQREELPAGLAENDPEPVFCGSPEELASLLSGGYEGWQKYRNKVSLEDCGI